MFLFCFIPFPYFFIEKYFVFFYIFLFIKYLLNYLQLTLPIPIVIPLFLLLQEAAEAAKELRGW